MNLGETTRHGYPLDGSHRVSHLSRPSTLAETKHDRYLGRRGSWVRVPPSRLVREVAQSGQRNVNAVRHKLSQPLF